MATRIQRLLIWLLRQIYYYRENRDNYVDEQDKCSTGLFIRRQIWSYWTKEQLDNISHRLVEIGKILGEKWDPKELEKPRGYSVHKISKTKASKFVDAFAQIVSILVDGVFDKDPEVHKDARFYKSLTYNDVLEKNLKVMDMTAVSLCREGKLPVMVFNINKNGNIVKIVMGDNLGTTIKE